MPHATQAHTKMENLLEYLHANTKVEREDFQHCFEGDFNCQEKKDLIQLSVTIFCALGAACC